MNQEWECAWDTWKQGQFANLETDEMGLQAQGIFKKVVKLGRELKVNSLCVSYRHMTYIHDIQNLLGLCNVCRDPAHKTTTYIRTYVHTVV